MFLIWFDDVIIIIFFLYFLVPGVIGTLQALEAIKIAVGIKRILIVYI